MCLADSECKQQIRCSGQSSVCPEDNPIYFKPDKTLCGDGKLLCINGSCSLSICALHSLQPCQLQEPESHLCMIACQTGNSQCKPFHEIGSTTQQTLYLPCKSR